MTPADLLATLAPSILRLTVAAIRAIAAGQPELAARKAEEAARRNSVRLAADAALRAKAKAKK